MRDKKNTFDKIIINKRQKMKQNSRNLSLRDANSSFVFKTEDFQRNKKSLNNSYLGYKSTRHCSKSNDNEYLFKSKLNKPSKEKKTDIVKRFQSTFYNTEYCYSGIRKNYRTKSYYLSSKTEKNNLYNDTSFEKNERSESCQSNTSYVKPALESERYFDKKRKEILKNIGRSITPSSPKSSKLNKTQGNIYINPQRVDINLKHPDILNSRKRKGEFDKLHKVESTKLESLDNITSSKLLENQESFDNDRKDIPRISNIYKNMIFTNKNVPSIINKHKINSSIKYMINESQLVIDSVLHEGNKIGSRSSQKN